MTIENGPPEGRPSSADVVRSVAGSSPALWHEILERLREVQESQVKLADAIEVLGLMVQDALDDDGRADLEEPSDRAPWDLPDPPDAMTGDAPRPTSDPSDPVFAEDAGDPPGPVSDPPDQMSGDRPGTASPDPRAVSPGPFDVPSLGAAEAPGAAPAEASGGEPVPYPETLNSPAEDLPHRFKDSGGPADSFITSVEAPAPWAWSGAAEVQEPAVETDVPEPVFYVPSFDEEVLPATSVAELSASALDAALATEFGAGNAQPVVASGIASPASGDEASLPVPEPHIPHADTLRIRARRRQGTDHHHSSPTGTDGRAQQGPRHPPGNTACCRPGPIPRRRPRPVQFHGAEHHRAGGRRASAPPPVDDRHGRTAASAAAPAAAAPAAPAAPGSQSRLPRRGVGTVFDVHRPTRCSERATPAVAGRDDWRHRSASPSAGARFRSSCSADHGRATTTTTTAASCPRGVGGPHR